MKRVAVVLTALALILGGCQPKADSEPKPGFTVEIDVNPAKPGTFCGPPGEKAKTVEDTPMVCTGTPKPRWRKEVRSK